MDEARIATAIRKRTYHSLDGLRGVAALSVVFMHYRRYVAPIAPGSAYLAVDLFFLMSGFVLANAYQDRLGHSLGAMRFAVLRVIRLYPLYLAGTLIALSIEAGLQWQRAGLAGVWHNLAGVAVPALLMLPGPGAGTSAYLYSLNFPAWSLLFELVGNAAYGGFAKLRRGWMLPATVVCAAALLVFGAVLFGTVDGGWKWSNGWLGLPRIFFAFFLGVIGYRLHAAGRLPVVKFPLAPLFLLVAAVLYVTPAAQFRVIYEMAVIFVVFPVVVWLCIVNEPQRAVKFYTLAGLISYPLYTIHGPVSTLVELVCYHVFGYDAFYADVTRWSPWLGLAMIAAVSALSWLLAVSYDVWARRWLTRLADRVSPVRDDVPVRNPINRMAG
jgi:peptidoglycan/LPS O-acetylase OafA/YrhL